MPRVAAKNRRKSPAVAPKPAVLERAGVRYFKSRSAAVPRLEAVDAVHHLNPEERAGLKKVERGAILRSALAGALSTVAAAAAEIYADSLMPVAPAAVEWQHQVQYWS
ncbi:MAG: hypothetical protein ACYC8T_23595, partial [Myxococcaceae bacterium]